MATHSRLGDHLRARRVLVSPEDVGFPVGNEQRRVAGLRRDEVAILAGISTEYYLRLEPGREMHPSDQVLDVLARALTIRAPLTSSAGGDTKARVTVPRGPHTRMHCGVGVPQL